ncbi:hypothetical protein BDV59DRAFT_30094 [Aspergillus ambiguus]|uniref:uncharacterized protein n=1 Tax=Aspergillus ambiguus TaxID=176160 RepID=UPI003CCE3A8D
MSDVSLFSVCLLFACVFCSANGLVHYSGVEGLIRGPYIASYVESIGLGLCCRQDRPGLCPYIDSRARPEFRNEKQEL